MKYGWQIWGMGDNRIVGSAAAAAVSSGRANSQQLALKPPSTPQSAFESYFSMLVDKNKLLAK